MSKLKDIKPYNIFTEIAKQKTLAIFDFITADKMDLYYNSMYTNKTMSNIVDENTIEDVATILIGFYGTKWDNIIAQCTYTIEGLKSYSEKLTEKYTDTTDMTNERVGEVSAYNEDTFANDDKDTTTDKGTVKREREQILEKINPNELENIKNYLQTTIFYDTIISDVNNILTLSIYESEEN